MTAQWPGQCHIGKKEDAELNHVGQGQSAPSDFGKGAVAEATEGEGLTSCFLLFSVFAMLMSYTA